MDGGISQRTFVYIKDAIEAVHLMIVRLSCLSTSYLVFHTYGVLQQHYSSMQENPQRANGHIFNVGNPNNEVTVKELAELMAEVSLLVFER